MIDRLNRRGLRVILNRVNADQKNPSHDRWPLVNRWNGFYDVRFRLIVQKDSDNHEGRANPCAQGYRITEN